MTPRVRGALERLLLVALGVALERLSAPAGPLAVLVFAADAPFLWLLWHRGGARWKRWAYLYGFARFAAGLWWLSSIVWFHVLLAPLLLALTYLAWGGALRFLARRGAPFLFTVATTAVLQEMAQAYVVVKGGMPWPARSLALADFDGLRGFACVFGAYGLSFLAALASAWVSGLPSLVSRSPYRPLLVRRIVQSGLVVAALVLLAHVRGSLRVSQVDARIATGHAFVTRPLVIVQANVAQSLKHSGEADDGNVILERHERLTHEALVRLADRRLEPIAVLWPETMVPWPFLDAPLALRFPDAWRNEATVIHRLSRVGPPGSSARYLLGVSYYFEGASGPRPSLDDHENADSLVLVDPRYAPEEPPEPKPDEKGWLPPWEGPDARHDKRVLVPFAEWMPLGSVFPALVDLKKSVSPIPELTPGADDQRPFLLDLAPPPPDDKGGANRPVLAGTIICFEIAYPAACRDWREKGATVLLNAGNYGWFGDTTMPEEVIALGRLRAAETAVTVAIAGNTGPSAIIDPAGRVTARLSVDGKSQFVEGSVDGALVSDVGTRTMYLEFGDGPWLVAALLVVALTFIRRRRPSEGAAPTADAVPEAGETPPEPAPDATPGSGPR